MEKEEVVVAAPKAPKAKKVAAKVVIADTPVAVETVAPVVTAFATEKGPQLDVRTRAEQERGRQSIARK